MSLTEAMEESYASAARGDIIYETVEMDHVAFAAPVRVITGVDEAMSLPLALGGPTVLFEPLQVSITLPGVTEDGPTPAKVRIDNVSGLLLPYLREAIRATAPIKVIYRAYTTADLTQPGDVINDLELRSVTLNETYAEGSLGFREIELQAFPLKTYDDTFYPALQL
ncbi:MULTISPECIES: DUF1833 family protein [unclassified Chelatococcus]|uniref:DUF1833 family protein n=1 Tax=unclassified Chelatococcus TaxID=2638111 RepID=UPI001BCE9843|nr:MULTISPECIES: DUF1833 family protein [unclassified Chelatococcus]MBS7698777.1 DUF1833 family protein [Chelatococcus sp. YT9]MBX3554641.1 DUF1833 family protein [Chelatococcus sp.]